MSTPYICANTQITATWYAMDKIVFFVHYFLTVFCVFYACAVCGQVTLVRSLIFVKFLYVTKFEIHKSCFDELEKYWVWTIILKRFNLHKRKYLNGSRSLLMSTQKYWIYVFMLIYIFYKQQFNLYFWQIYFPELQKHFIGEIIHLII